MSSLIRIDLSANVLDFGNKDAGGNQVYLPITYAEIVANHVLARASTGPAAKMMIWAFRLQEDKFLELDKEDFEILRGLIESNQVVLIFIRIAVLHIMDSSKGG